MFKKFNEWLFNFLIKYGEILCFFVLLFGIGTIFALDFI